MRNLFGACLVALLTTACCIFGAHHDPPRSIKAEVIAGQPTFRAGGFVVYEFAKNGGPPVVLLHELPGFTPDAWRLAQQLESDGFSVYVPLMFGRAGHNVGKLTMARVSVSPQWRAFDREATAPIAAKLVDVVSAVVARRGGAGVGVIGMCLTGNLPVALAARDANVKAIVLSQPSLPFCDTDDIALAHADIDRANARPIDRYLFFRFPEDKISKGKLPIFESAFPGKIDAQQMTAEPVPEDGQFRHPVLTSGLFHGGTDFPLPPSDCQYDGDELKEQSLTPRCAYDKMLKYLRKRL
jgi:dienelactone hydrolase